jgi:hypothetical protein
LSDPLAAKGPLSWIVVSLTTGGEIRGVLRERATDAIVLGAPAVAGEQNGRITWQPLVGEVVIPMERIEYWQRGLPPVMTDPWADEVKA